MATPDSINERDTPIGVPAPVPGASLAEVAQLSSFSPAGYPEPRRISGLDTGGKQIDEKIASSGVNFTPNATRTVLIVDDEELTRSMLARNLGSHGLKILQAGGAKEALCTLNSQTVDLVLMDISMPVFDGFSTLRLIRQKFSATRLPVIMMTSLEGRDQILESFRNGANDYIAKPVDFDVLFARVKSIFYLQDAQAALFESEERYALVSKGTNDGMWDWNLQTNQLYLSERWRTMVGRESSDWHPVGDEWMDLIHNEDRDRVRAELQRHVEGISQHFEAELRMACGDGHRWMLCRGMAVRDENGVAYRIAGSLTDITEGKVADSLTGLPNRVLFRDRVARCVQEYEPNSNKEFAVLYLDVDGFKLINDTYGHDVGDDFLVALAKRLHQGLRQADAILSRLGGDEFAVLVENLEHVDHAMAVAERLRDRMTESFSIGGRDLFVGASIGISYSDGRKVEVDTLLREADTAMYFCKVRPELELTLFQDEMLADATEQLELGADLRQAIEKSELQLHYQPIVDAHSGRIVGVESLTRWHHGTLGPISPDRFIPIAESNGFINELGKWALKVSCRQAKAWQDEFANELTICVNVSIRQLSDTDFFSTVKDVLLETGLEARFLRLEVTESLLTQKPEDTIDILQRVRDIGVTIAVDDFGTGYSSLAYLHQFPLQILKVDRSFVDQMLQAEKSMAIVRSIIALARSLNLNLVAEGVETQEQLEALRELGCDYIQGYFISRPLDANSAHAFIAAQAQEHQPAAEDAATPSPLQQ